MNCYILTEDETSFKKVLPFWLKYMEFPCTQRVGDINEITQNSYVLQSGQGIYQLVDAVLYETLQTILESDKIIDELIIFLDAEELLPAKRLKEVEKKIENFPNISKIKCHIKIIVCNCCFETWLLCNQSLYPNVPPDITNSFYKFYSYYNVCKNDPEQMEKSDIIFENTRNTKGGFHFAYFHEMCRYNGVKYTKKDPRFVETQNFFDQLIKRIERTPHGNSFRDFITYISNLSS